MSNFEENPNGKLTMTFYNETASYEFEGSDVTMDKLLKVFVNLCKAHTFPDACIKNAMASYLEDENQCECMCGCCVDDDSIVYPVHHTTQPETNLISVHPNNDVCKDNEKHTPYFDFVDEPDIKDMPYLDIYPDL